jgi:hypothetical protein
LQGFHSLQDFSLAVGEWHAEEGPLVEIRSRALGMEKLLFPEVIAAGMGEAERPFLEGMGAKDFGINDPIGKNEAVIPENVLPGVGMKEEGPMILQRK